MEKFTEVLKDLMLENETTLKQLANDTGIKLGSLYFYFKHNSLPDLECAIKISEYFNCSINYLLGLDTNREFKPTLTNKTFIQNYEYLLKEKGVTNNKACNEMNINRNSIYYWRKGITPKMVNLIAMAKYFETSVDYLVGRSNER